MKVASPLCAALPFLAAADHFLQKAGDRRVAPARAPDVSFPESPGDALSRLPLEVAQQARDLALNLAWYRAKVDFGSADEAQSYQNAAGVNWAAMKSLANGFLDRSSLDNFADGFRWLALATSSYAADFLKSGATDMSRVQDHLRQLESIQEVGAELVQDMYQMSWGAAWFAANNCTKHTAESLSNFTSFQAHSARIAAQTVLHNLIFEPTQGRVTHEVETQVVGTQDLHNDASSDQRFDVAVQYTQGFTTAFLNVPGVRILINETFTAGFHYDVFAAGTLSTELLFNDSLSTQIMGVERNFTVPVMVPANMTYFVTAKVQEATLEVPISMSVSCGNKYWTFSGIWTGTARSHYTFDVHHHPPSGGPPAHVTDVGSEAQLLVIA